MRRINILSAVLLSIVTLGIYFLVLTYRNSKDIHDGDPNGFKAWRWLFWLGIPTFGLTFIVLAVVNWVRLRDMTKAKGVGDDTMMIMSLVFYFLFSPIGAVLWAVNWNQIVDRMGPTHATRAATPLSA